MMKPLFLSAAAVLLALATGPARAHQPQQQKDLSRPASSLPPSQPSRSNWPATIARTPRGHLIGNPEAETRLIEFISYTCPHCADFAARGEPALELAVLAPGKVSVEVRPVIRNGIDLAVTLLAQCGDPAGFKTRHSALMLGQPEWLGKARNAPATQQQIWMRGDKAGRANAAAALGLVAMLTRRGQSQAELDACLADDTAARALVENGLADKGETGVASTPSFAIDGKLLEGVHNWEALYPVLSARLAPKPG